MNRTRHTRGGSLPEMMVSLLFMGFVAGTMHQFSTAMINGICALERVSNAQEDVWTGIQFIQRDLRGARYSPAGTFAGGLRRAKPASVQVASDLDGDGDTDEPNELVAYSVNETTHTLMRALGNSPPQPVINHVAANGLLLAYYDSAGARFDVPDTGLTATDRARVRRIDVRLTVEVPGPDLRAGGPLLRTGRTSICLRNG